MSFPMGNGHGDLPCTRPARRPAGLRGIATWGLLLMGIAAAPVAWAQAAPARSPAAAAPPAAAASAAAPANSRLDAELFLQLLLGELNAYGNEPGTAYSLILDAAKKTDDPKLYERAVAVALQARSGESALAAARAWQKALPSREANRYVLQILIGLNRIGETAEPLKADLASLPVRDRLGLIATIPRLFGRAADKKLAASVVEQGLADQFKEPTLAAPAWATVGAMRLEAGDTAGALDAARRALAADAQSENGARLALALMGPQQPQAEELLRNYLSGLSSAIGAAATPAAQRSQHEVRMGYARNLLEAQRNAEAMAQLRSVVAQRADHPQAWLLIGSLELQDKKWADGERSLRRHVEITEGTSPSRRSPETNRALAQAYLQLSQVAEQNKELAKAEEWLSKIDNPDDLVAAQARRASLLAKQGKLEEGRRLLRSLPEKQPSDARMKLLAEVQLLRDNKQLKLAYELVAQRTQAGPFDHELLYEQAMLAEKVGEINEMERLLRAVIAAKPDYQHAYNALGYSLADRNVRLPEARALIVKALELAPGDPFITDSLGWVEFRAGNLAEAQRHLEKAFKARPDAEIAAHLGEVLWVRGQRDQALAIWREGFALNADNETLLETLKRLRVKL